MNGSKYLFKTAIEQGDIERVKKLIGEGVDINQTYAWNHTGLFCAVWHEKEEIVKFLLENGADPNICQSSDGQSALYMASQNDMASTVRLLLQYGANPNQRLTTDKQSTLYPAAQQGYLEVVKVLLEANADPNLATDEGQIPLYQAARNGHLEIVDLLLKAGSDPNKLCFMVQRTPFYQACVYGHFEVAKSLIDYGADIHMKLFGGHTGLYLAASTNNLDLVKHLIKLGASINVKTTDGLTPLHIACRKGNTDVVKYLIQAGADMEIPDCNMLKPIHSSLQFNPTSDITKELMKEHANITCVDSFGRSPHYFSAIYGIADVWSSLCGKVKITLPLDSKQKPEETVVSVGTYSNSPITRQRSLIPEGDVLRKYHVSLQKWLGRGEFGLKHCLNWIP